MSHLDEPYTRITNEILEEIARRKFNGTQYGIIICILRNTYGFQRKSHRLSLSFIAEATETKKEQVKRELDKLIKMNVIKVYAEGSYTISREIGFNKRYTEWQLEDSTLNRVHPNKSTPPELEYGEYPKKSTGGVPYLGHQERKVYKEIFKENSTTTDESEISVMNAFTKSFGLNVMPPLIHGYVKSLGELGKTDEMITELMLEVGESSSKPNLRFLQTVGDRWVTEGITSRAQAKALRESQRPITLNTERKTTKSGKPNIPIVESTADAQPPSEEEFAELMKLAEQMKASKEAGHEKSA